MKWLDAFSKKQTPERISGFFKVLILVQVALYLYHFFRAFRTWDQKWSLQGEVKLPFFEYPETWNKHLNFPDTVLGSYKKLDLTFTFTSFQEWFNIYTVGFLVLDLLKYIITAFVFWQLSKAMSEKSTFGLEVESSSLTDITAIKGDFKGFTTEGVKRLRLAALPIMFIPIFEHFSKEIFILYASTQSTFVVFQKYPSALIVGETGVWVYYFYATLILFGVSEIFRYGQHLKEETALTV